VLSDKLQSIPHMASSESGEPSAALTLLDAPTMAPLEGAPDLAATPTEAVEQWGASSDDNVDAPLVPEPRATAPMDGAASDEPRAAYVEPNMVESGYGPQS
jgi:hypothetical protein